MEATGHYQSPVVQYLEENQYLYIVINPLISNRIRKSSLRKVKTDAADAYLLGELFYKEEFEAFKKRGVQLLNLRYLTRQHESLSNMCVQAKLQFQAVLDQVFPEYKGVFGALYSKISLNFLLEFPTSNSVLQYQEHLAELERNIDALAEELDEYALIQSIPGISPKIAATILSEIGEIDRFNHPKKLVAFAGIDPSVFSSGKFTATQNRITKRGARQLRYALF